MFLYNFLRFFQEDNLQFVFAYFIQYHSTYSMFIGQRGDVYMKWVALQPHSTRVLGSILTWVICAELFSCLNEFIPGFRFLSLKI